MLVRLDNLQAWRGEPVNGVRHPLNIEQMWNDEELASAGLAKPASFTAPEGKVRTGDVRYVLVEGAVREEYDIEDAPPAPVPPSISDRQFFQAMALAGGITQAEALAAVRTGDIPAALAAIIAQMPAEAKFNAEMLLSGATVFERTHALTEQLGAAMGWTSAQIDELFRMAGAL